MYKRYWFHIAGGFVFIVFLALLCMAVILANLRSFGGMGIDVATIQKIRFEAAQNQREDALEKVR